MVNLLSKPMSRRSAMGTVIAFGAALAGCKTTSKAASGPSREKHFNSDGVRIRYLEAGAGEPVILVHGFSSNAERQWVNTGVLSKLSAHFTVYAIDGRGHGLSDKPHDPSQYGPEAARDVTRMLDHLNLSQAHIVGYSLGAILMGYQVTQTPDRFKTCVLAGATPRFRWTAADQKKLEQEAAEMDQGSKRSQILRLWPKDKPLPTDEEIRKISERDLAGQDYHALAASRRGGANVLVTAAQIAAIQVPTLGIVGTADPYLAEFQAMKLINPRIELATVEGASHSTAPGRPEFASDILSFLMRHASAAA